MRLYNLIKHCSGVSYDKTTDTIKVKDTSEIEYGHLFVGAPWSKHALIYNNGYDLCEWEPLDVTREYVLYNNKSTYYEKLYKFR